MVTPMSASPVTPRIPVAGRFVCVSTGPPETTVRLVCLITGTDAGREQPRRMLILVSVSNHDNSDDLNDDIDDIDIDLIMILIMILMVMMKLMKILFSL